MTDNSPLISYIRPRHRRLIGIACGAALCLALPATAFASSTAKSSAHHDGIATHPAAEISGTILSLGTSSMVIQDRSGFWRTIVLSTTTTYSEGPMKVAPVASASNLAVGLSVDVGGTVDLNHTSLDATSVKIRLASVTGVVTSVTATAVVVSQSHSSTAATIDINPQTVVFSHANVVPVSTVVVGSFVEGFGVTQPDSSLLALYLGVDPNHRSFDHDSDFGFTLPNRYGPHHFHGKPMHR